MFQAALFDLDGTIVNTDLYVVLNYARLFKKYAPSKMPTLEEMVYLSGPSLDVVFTKYFPDLDHSLLKKDFASWAIENSNFYSSLYKGEKEVLDSLILHGVKLGLVTNKSTSATYSCLSYFNLLDCFSIILPAEKCLKKKPDPWPIEECINQLKVAKSNTIYIGDDGLDMQAGFAAGVKTGLVHFGLKDLSLLTPNYHFDSYKDIERVILNGKDQ